MEFNAILTDLRYLSHIATWKQELHNLWNHNLNHDCSLFIGWLVVLRINVDLAIFQPYLDLEAGDNQSLKIQVARPGIEPRSSRSASQELNHSATAAPSLFMKYFRILFQQATVSVLFSYLLPILTLFALHKPNAFRSLYIVNLYLFFIFFFYFWHSESQMVMTQEIIRLKLY